MTEETKRITLEWEQDLRLRGGAPGGPEVVIDGDNAAGPGPMLTLLLAAAACSGSDVVVILQKMRVALREIRIEASGIRREQEPRRYTAIHFEYHLAGDGLDEAGPAARSICRSRSIARGRLARARYRRSPMALRWLSAVAALRRRHSGRRSTGQGTRDPGHRDAVGPRAGRRRGLRRRGGRPRRGRLSAAFGRGRIGR